MPGEPITDGLFEVDGDAVTLLGGFSPTSGHTHFPRGEVCPYTGAEDVEPRRLSRDGTVWAATTVTIAPPGYAGDVPYGFGVVELPEAVRVVTRLHGELAVGDRVTCVAEVVDTPEGPRTVWAFAAAAAAGGGA